MSTVISLIISYIEVLFLLFTLCTMMIIFIKSENKEVKLKWFARAIVITLILITSIIDMFVHFSYNLRNYYNIELMQNVSTFAALISSMALIVVIFCNKALCKYLLK